MEDIMPFMPTTLSSSYTSHDTFTAIFLLICFTLVLFVAFRYGNMMEHLVRDGSSSVIPPIQPLPHQMIGQVYNPFAVSLINEHRASMKDGVTLSITAKNPCWLGVYWGSKIAEVYPILHRPWHEFRDRVVTDALFSDISMHHEDIRLYESVANRLVSLRPPLLDLGAPPRDRYPLLVLIVDSIACEMPDEEITDCHHIVCIMLLIHLKDEQCSGDSHIFSQYVRTPHGKPHDMKQLYVSRSNEPVTRVTSSDVDGGDGSDLLSGDVATSALCTICQAAPVERALLPCRHACVCTNCCAVLLNCPMCRTFITSSFAFITTDDEGV
jgi:hypothetical protein